MLYLLRANRCTQMRVRKSWTGRIGQNSSDYGKRRAHRITFHWTRRQKRLVRQLALDVYKGSRNVRISLQNRPHTVGGERENGRGAPRFAGQNCYRRRRLARQSPHPLSRSLSWNLLQLLFGSQFQFPPISINCWMLSYFLFLNRKSIIC